jgi:outer membrane protein assembly factor BamE (lipoprotein component of BamABCDE complex)
MEMAMRFGVLAVVLGLGGCAAESPKLTHVAPAAPAPSTTQATVAEFQPGVTTVDQVLQALGPPSSDIVTGDGNRKLVYSTGRGAPQWLAYLPILSAFSNSDTTANTVELRFHRDGTLASVSRSAT